MSSDPRFSCNFLDFKTERNPKPGMYEEYFLNYDTSKWKAGSGGGAFKFFDGKGMEYSLTISEDSRYGIMLAYEKWDDQNNKSIGSWYSVGNESELAQMFENEDELLTPIGAYMNPEDAWLVVKNFLSDPTEISQKVKWIDAEDIPWPEE